MRLPFALLLLALAPTVHSAESYDGCAGFIDAVPATISTQGTWCLRKDLSTAVASGAAITIATNNVTIDCNGFKLGGLGAGPGTLASGVYADQRLNATVRNCAIRGFHTGVQLVGGNGGGHLVEDNRIDQSTAIGLYVFGGGNLIQRNRILDTGGNEMGGANAIIASADIRDNTIDGLWALGADGIDAYGDGSEVRGNRLRNFSSSVNRGIALFGQQQSAVDNRILGVAGGTALGEAITAMSTGTSFCRDNLIAGFETGLHNCGDNGGNVVH